MSAKTGTPSGEKIAAEKLARESARRFQNKTVKLLTHILQNMEPVSNVFISSTAALMRNLNMARPDVEAALFILMQSGILLKLNNNTWKVAEEYYMKPVTGSGITAPPGGSCTLADWTKMYFGHFSGSETTKAGYFRIMYKHVLPALGSIPLNELTAEDIEKYLDDKMRSGLSANTVAKHYTLLKRILRIAMEDKRIVLNPIDGVAPPKVVKPTLKIYSKAQIKQMLRLASGTSLHLIFALAFFLALSRSEICGLMWEDIDFTRCEVSIKRERMRVNNKIIVKPLDTPEAYRTLYIPDMVMTLLRNAKTWQEAEELKNPAFKMSGYVLVNRNTGNPTYPDYISELMQDFTKKHGFPNYGLKGLRATFGVQSIENKANPIELTKVMGYSCVSRMIDRFAREVNNNGSATLRTMASKYS